MTLGKALSVFLVLNITVTLAACGQDTAMKQADMIVYGDWLLSMDEDSQNAGLYESGAVAVVDSKIVAVGSAADVDANWQSATKISGEGKVLMPGLVNAHTHTSMTLFRGMADDLPLMEWLEGYIFPMEDQFVDADFVRVGTQLACYEMIKTGTTSFVDMYFYPDQIADVVDRCGLRSVVTAPMIDFPSPGFAGWDDSFSAGVEFVKRWQENDHPRITPGLAPHAPYTVSREHLVAVGAAAQELGAPISIHLAEDKSEIAIVEDQYGMTPVRHVAATGLFDGHVIAAHVVWPDAEEMQILADKGVGVIHNPTSNLKTAAGVAPVPQMLAAGVTVGLATDGAASNNDLDMWGEIRFAALLNKGVQRDATLVPAMTALKLATSYGAKAAGLSAKTGVLKVGKQADMIQVAFDRPSAQPMYNIISHLAYVLDSRDVRTTIVDGKLLMQDGNVLTIDQEKLSAEVAEKAAQIKAALAK